MSEDRDRIEAYLRWREDATSTRIERSGFGTALFNDDFPSYIDGNLLRADRPADATAGQLITETDRLYDTFAHRAIVVPDEAVGSRLAATFGGDGWEVDRLVYMVQRRDADRESEVTVEECTLDEVYPLLLETNVHSHGGMTRSAAEANAAVRRAFVDLTGARFFVARVDGALAGFCELYVHDGVAEIDDVHTLERVRRRGIAGALSLTRPGTAETQEQTSSSSSRTMPTGRRSSTRSSGSTRWVGSGSSRSRPQGESLR